tara:strand:+ start:103 stop:513 length:411 start_codon:yes stop_codon:yes gene_type:complete
MANFELQYLKAPGKNRIQGIAYPMRLDGVGGYLTSNEDLGSLRDCVVQLIMTPRGSRVMRPDFGTDLRSSLFEPLNATLVENLRSQIIDTITKYEPRVIVKDLGLFPNYENNSLLVKLIVTSKDDLLNAQTVELLV